MSILKSIVILNIFVIVGAIGALFIIPGSTSLWIWAVASVLVGVLLNVAIARRVREGKSAARSNMGAMLAIGIILAVLSIALRYMAP